MKFAILLEIDVIDKAGSPYEAAYIGLAEVGTMEELETFLHGGIQLLDSDIEVALSDAARTIKSVREDK